MRSVKIVLSWIKLKNDWRIYYDRGHQLWLWWLGAEWPSQIRTVSSIARYQRDCNHPLGEEKPCYHPAFDYDLDHEDFEGLFSFWGTRRPRRTDNASAQMNCQKGCARAYTVVERFEHDCEVKLQRGKAYRAFYQSKFDHGATLNDELRRVSGYEGDLHVKTQGRPCTEGQLTAAVEALEVLVQGGAHVDDSVVCRVLKRCIAQKELVLGARVHTVAARNGLESNAYVANHIICMYVYHRKLEEATQVFRKVLVPTPTMWSSIILAHARHGKPMHAVNFYQEMRKSSLKADSHILVAVLKSCARAKDLAAGMEIHADILSTSDKPNAFVRNCLMDMYSKCGSLEDARRVFDNSPNRDVVTWNTIIGAYAQHGYAQEALDLYSSMEHEGMTPANHVTFVCLLQACAKLGALNKGKQLHAHIHERGLEADVVVCNCLVNMYAKCGSLEDAQRVFDNLSTKDVVTWTALIAGYAQNRLGEEALTLYGRMQQEGITPADAVTFVCLLQACATIGDLHCGVQLHAQVQARGFEADVTVGNSLVNMYAKCGSFEDACRVFDNLVTRDVVTWNAMITGYSQHGLHQEALNLYASMQQEGITPADAVTFVYLLQACGNVVGLEKGKEIHAEISKVSLDASELVLGNALIDMYSKCGSLVDAQQVFDALTVRDVMTWSALITGYARQGESQPVFFWFERMRQEGLQPNCVTFLSVFMVCSHVGLVDKGLKYFEAMSRDYGITPTIEHYNCMVDLLGRAGRVDEAMEMINKIPFPPSADTWRCLLGACQKWKKLELGRQAFECTVRVDANDATAYVIMSNIYASAGMWEEAKEVHSMRVKARAWKEPGQSWLMDIAGIPRYAFVVRDSGHPEWRHIYEKLKYLRYKIEDDSTLYNMFGDREAALCIPA